MNKIARICVSLGMAAGLALAAQSAMADPYYASANFVDEANAFGGVVLSDSNLVGATFQITGGDLMATMIGGNFSQYSSGTLFGAIYNTASGLPTGTALASVTFDVGNGGDESFFLNTPVNLTSGNTYAVVFGSGLFGATGGGALVDTQDGPLPGAAFVQSLDSGASFTAYNDAVVRVTLAVPEPSTWLMIMLGGPLLLGAAKSRRKS